MDPRTLDTIPRRAENLSTTDIEMEGAKTIDARDDEVPRSGELITCTNETGGTQTNNSNK